MKRLKFSHLTLVSSIIPVFNVNTYKTALKKCNCPFIVFDHKKNEVTFVSCFVYFFLYIK